MKNLLTTELLLLPDGRILVHNLTQTFAELLNELNPEDPQIQPRARKFPHRPFIAPESDERGSRITYHASRFPSQ